MTTIINDTSLKQLARNNSILTGAKIDSILVGMVRKCYKTPENTIKYVVEVWHHGRGSLMHCQSLTRWGGLQNYEEYRLRGYKNSDVSGAEDKEPSTSYEQRVGDTVLIACIQGHPNNGVILGGLSHPARTTLLNDQNITYASQFNGIATTISEKGAWRVTNRGVKADNLKAAIPGKPVPKEIVDPKAGSYIEIGDDFSVTLADADKQSIKINKSATSITLTSGKVAVTLSGAGKAISATTDGTLTFTVKEKATLEAADLDIKIKKETKINTPKIAIGSSSFELIDGLIKLIDAIGTLTAISPNGPCQPLNGTATWPQVDQIKSQLNSIKTSL